MKQDFKSQLLIFIRKIIKEELQSLVKKEVKLAINEVLAEHFLKNLSQDNNAKSTLNVVMETQPQSEQKIVSKKDNLKQKEELKELLMKRLGVSDNPMMKMIYEDISVDDVKGGIQNPAVNGAFIDSDDDGVDPSLFGL